MTLYDTIATVKVGPAAKEFHVHKGLICHYSQFFRGAFKGGFKESEGVVTLADESPESFQAFFTWLYGGRLVEDESSFDLKTMQGCTFLAKTYVFAEAHGIPVL